jgi:sugar (pentulose or hexulose) kinase
METAGEGGAWGMALLASYLLNKAGDQALETYLAKMVFAGERGSTIAPDQTDVTGFATFMDRYKKGLPIERAALEGLK